VDQKQKRAAETCNPEMVAKEGPSGQKLKSKVWGGLGKEIRVNPTHTTNSILGTQTGQRTFKKMMDTGEKLQKKSNWQAQ